jgi:hypothetical protein
MPSAFLLRRRRFPICRRLPAFLLKARLPITANRSPLVQLAEALLHRLGNAAANLEAIAPRTTGYLTRFPKSHKCGTISNSNGNRPLV